MKRLSFALCLCLILQLETGASGADSLDGDPLAESQSFAGMQNLGPTSSLRFGGFAESRNQFSLRDPDTPVSLRQRVQLEAHWERDVLSFYGNLEGSYEGAAPSWPGRHNPWRADLKEAYLTYDTDNLDIFAGRKIHRWGTGDGINPMDLINPLDMRDPFSSGRADNRVPAWMLDSTLSGGGVSLEAVFLPRAEVIDLPSQGAPWEPLALRSLRKARDQGFFGLDTSDKPDRWFADVEYGGRFSAAVTGWDLSLMAFRGFADSPFFAEQTRGMRSVVAAEHPRFTAFGLSFATGFGSQTVRGEFAYKPEHPAQYTAGWSRADLWQGVLGWDYDLDGRYYLNLQAFADIREGRGKVTGERFHGAAYEISGKWLRDALKAGARGKLYSSGDGTLTEVFLEYELDDHWKFFTGVMWWTGTDTSLLGEYKKNDFAYATVRYSF